METVLLNVYFKFSEIFRKCCTFMTGLWWTYSEVHLVVPLLVWRFSLKFYGKLLDLKLLPCCIYICTPPPKSLRPERTFFLPYFMDLVLLFTYFTTKSWWKWKIWKMRNLRNLKNIKRASKLTANYCQTCHNVILGHQIVRK